MAGGREREQSKQRAVRAILAMIPTDLAMDGSAEDLAKEVGLVADEIARSAVETGLAERATRKAISFCSHSLRRGWTVFSNE